MSLKFTDCRTHNSEITGSRPVFATKKVQLLCGCRVIKTAFFMSLIKEILTNAYNLKIMSDYSNPKIYDAWWRFI